MPDDEYPKPSENISLAEYYQNSTVLDAFKQFLGNSTRYVTVGHEIPSTNTHPTVLEPSVLPAFLRQNVGNVEIHGSLLQNPHPEYRKHPARTLMIFDIEYYNTASPTIWLSNPQKMFELILPTVNTITDAIDRFNIPYQIVMTGRGFHVLSSLSGNTEGMNKLIGLGKVKEHSISQRCNRVLQELQFDMVVADYDESAHVGMCRLQQYIINSCINKARRNTTLRNEISDRHGEGIALDNTSRLYPSDTRTIGVVGSPYFLKFRNHGHEEELLFRIPFKPKIDTLSDVLIQRHSAAGAVKLLEKSSSIPDGSNEINALIEIYKNSDLYRFHQEIDNILLAEDKETQAIESFLEKIPDENTRNELWDLYYYPQQRMLNPDYLDKFIWEVYKLDSYSHESLRTLYNYLKTLYETTLRDELGMFNDPSRRAIGWIETIIGQKYEQDSSVS